MICLRPSDAGRGPSGPLGFLRASASGRRAAPVVAVLWLPALWLMVIVGLIAWFDRTVEDALDDVFGPDGGGA